MPLTVAESFSRHAGNYDAHSRLQEACATLLWEEFVREREALPDGPILEIGCGTGLVSERLALGLPDRDLDLTDLSAAMLAVCRQRLATVPSGRGARRWFTLDGERVDGLPAQGYAGIVSGLTVQWFADLAAALGGFASRLRPQGVLGFSFLADGSFPEWDAQCAALSLPVLRNPLPRGDAVARMARAAGLLPRLRQEAIAIEYRSASDFFHHLKKTGSGLALAGRHLSTAQMRRLLAHWDRSSPGGVTVSSLVCTVTAVKEGT